MLPHVATLGWNNRAMEAAGLGDDGPLLFPGGAPDMVEAYSDLADRRMEQAAASLDVTGMGLTARVRAVIALRFAQNRMFKSAVRRGLGVLAMPGRTGLAAICTARTVDAIWHAAGDRSADFSWYTKRAILSAVYGSTLLIWIRDQSEDDAETLAFLDRRLAGVGRIGKTRRRIERAFKRRA
jgi:ubiquinone biosynthesis protein COQ9